MSAFLTSDSSSYISLDDFDDDSPALSSDLDPGWLLFVLIAKS